MSGSLAAHGSTRPQKKTGRIQTQAKRSDNRGLRCRDKERGAAAESPSLAGPNELENSAVARVSKVDELVAGRSRTTAGMDRLRSRATSDRSRSRQRKAATHFSTKYESKGDYLPPTPSL
ncbi:hypothetical protein K3495_g12553 [Podosphaera aphanis]|nr:hypothetical protein K3495_g12553 [Podosphaera aphanis]